MTDCISRRAAAGAILFAALAAAGSAHAQAPAQWPTRSVRLITPFPVGGGPEGVLRLVADKLARKWGQPVVVENRPGGNGFIAINAFKTGAKDGHDLIQLDTVHVSAYPHLFKKLPYDVNADFEVLAPLFRTYFFVTTAANSKYKTMGDLIADARANPGKLAYGSWSIGNPVHLGSALLEMQAGIDMTHAVYKETTQLYTGVANGELAFAIGTNATAGPLYRAGKLKYLAVAAPRRLAGQFKDVPTVAESGGPRDFEVTGWTAIAAPRGLPPALSDKIRTDIQEALASAEVREKFASFSYEPFPVSGEQFTQFQQAESARFAGIIKKTGAQLD